MGNNLILCLLALSWIHWLPVMTYTGKVLVVSFDGFRWDYLDIVEDLGTPNFDAFIAAGTRAPYMTSTFATFTFPTHYTMATGLYEESHGVISNWMYDPDFKELFTPATKEEKWWDGGEPIWITAVKHGKRSGCFFWPGTETEIRGLRPNHWMTFNLSIPFRDRIDHVLDWFLKDHIDIGTLYFEQPDQVGHKYGPHSEEVRLEVKELDGVLGYLMTRLRETDLRDTVNIILVSDHGMTEVGPDKLVNIPDYMNLDLLESFQENGAVCQVFPKPGKLQEVYDLLKGKHPRMHVYKAEEIPEHWRYRNHRRIGPLLLVMDEHWSCTTNVDNSWNQNLGSHGYHNDLTTMRPIFMASGPDFKENHEIAPFQQVDIYPLLCELLQITPSANNGSLDNLKDILREPLMGSGRAHQSEGITVLMNLLVLLVLASI